MSVYSEVPNALGHQLGGHVDGAAVTHTGPAMGRNQAVADVQCDHEGVSEAIDGPPQEVTIIEGSRPDDEPGHTRGDGRLDRGARAQSAAEMHGSGEVRRNARDERGVNGFAVLSPVEVDDVQGGRAGGGELRAPGRADRR